LGNEPCGRRGKRTRIDADLGSPRRPAQAKVPVKTGISNETAAAGRASEADGRAALGIRKSRPGAHRKSYQENFICPACNHYIKQSKVNTLGVNSAGYLGALNKLHGLPDVLLSSKDQSARSNPSGARVDGTGTRLLPQTFSS